MEYKLQGFIKLEFDFRCNTQKEYEQIVSWFDSITMVDRFIIQDKLNLNLPADSFPLIRVNFESEQKMIKDS